MTETKNRTAGDLVRGLLRRVRWGLLGLRLLSLRLYPNSWLVRLGREHHVEAVRRRAWILSGTIQAGTRCYFGWHVSVTTRERGKLAVIIGDRVAVSPGVYFIAVATANASRLHQIPGFEFRFVRSRIPSIRIGDDTWIGAGAIILPGVTIGRCCVIGAGAVVEKDVPDYTVVAGPRASVVGDVRQWRLKP